MSCHEYPDIKGIYIFLYVGVIHQYALKYSNPENQFVKPTECNQYDFRLNVVMEDYKNYP